MGVDRGDFWFPWGGGKWLKGSQICKFVGGRTASNSK